MREAKCLYCIQIPRQLYRVSSGKKLFISRWNLPTSETVYYNLCFAWLDHNHSNYSWTTEVILVLAHKVCHLYLQTWWPQLEQTGSEWGRCVGEDCFQLVGSSDLHLDPDCTRPVTRQRFWPGQLKWLRGENKWTDERTCIKYCQV